MESKKVKQEEKTLKQMYEEINQKLAETKEKREAFSLVSKQIQDETILMRCASNLFEALSTLAISTDGINFKRCIKIYHCNSLSEEEEYLSNIITVEALQKIIDLYSPEKLHIEKIYFSYYNFEAIVELV